MCEIDDDKYYKICVQFCVLPVRISNNELKGIFPSDIHIGVGKTFRKVYVICTFALRLLLLIYNQTIISYANDIMSIIDFINNNMYNQYKILTKCV